MLFSFFKILFFLLFVTALNVYAQRLNLTYFSEKQGLHIKQVDCIHEDKLGYLWVGTMGSGVARYKGDEFKIFNSSNGLAFDDIITVNSNPKDSSVWFGTNGAGISIYSNNHFIPKKKIPPLNAKIIYSIYFNHKNQTLIGSSDNGLFIEEHNKFKKIDTGQFKPQTIYAITQDEKNNYYIATHNGLFFSDSELKYFSKINTPFDGPIFSIFRDHNNNIWCGSTLGHILKVKNKEIITLYTNTKIKDSFIGGITEDKFGVIWAASDIGLISIKNDHLLIYETSDGLKEQLLYTIACDKDKNIWIGGDVNPLCLLQNNGLETYYRKNYLTDNISSTSISHFKKTIFLGSTKGTQIIEESKNLNYLNTVITNKNISCIYNYNNHIFYFTSDGYLYESSDLKSEPKVLISPDRDQNITITQIAKDSHGNLLGITYGEGVCKINLTNKKFEILNITGLDKNLIDIKYFNQKYYFASYFQGLYSYDLKSNKLEKVKIKGLKQDLSGVFCLEILKDKLAIGTTGQGIIIINKNNEVAKQITQEDGLASNMIKSIKYFSNDLFYVSSPNGICEFTLSQYKKKRFFGKTQGLDLENLLPEIIYLDSISSKLYVGIKNGFQTINLKGDFNQQKPQFSISKFYINNIDTPIIVTDKFYFNEEAKIELAYNKNNIIISFENHSPASQVEYAFFLENFDQAWSLWNISGNYINTNLPPGKYVLKIKARVLNTNIESAEQKITIIVTPPFYKTWWFISLCILFGAISIFMFIRYRTQKLIKEKQILETKVEERTHELKESNLKLEHAYTDIKDSINYAEKIQRAILPMDELIKQHLPNSFVLFHPRDVVSGDFYWFGSINVDEDHEKDYVLFAAADCTGHGVPGAFMSMVGNTILNEIVLTNKIFNPGEILHQLHLGVKKALKQNENQSRDGMDLALCCIDVRNNKLLYAGANRPLWIIDNNGLTEIKATKSAIGGFTDDSTVFQEHIIELDKGMEFYAFSDGYPDQFGGNEGKKFMTKKLKELLISMYKQPFDVKRNQLEKTIFDWMGTEHEQVDDILVIGFKI